MEFNQCQLKTLQVGSSKFGGFWDTPFAGEKGSWSVKGSNKLGPKYECGDNLDPTVDGKSYETKH